MAKNKEIFQIGDEVEILPGFTDTGHNIKVGSVGTVIGYYFSDKHKPFVHFEGSTSCYYDPGYTKLNKRGWLVDDIYLRHSATTPEEKEARRMKKILAKIKQIDKRHSTYMKSKRIRNISAEVIC